MNTVQLLTSNTNCNTATICSLNVTMTVMSYCTLLRPLYSTVLPAKLDVISFSYTDALCSILYYKYFSLVLLLSH